LPDEKSGKSELMLQLMQFSRTIIGRKLYSTTYKFCYKGNKSSGIQRVISLIFPWSENRAQKKELKENE
jgi:hypothetical protein